MMKRRKRLAIRRQFGHEAEQRAIIEEHDAQCRGGRHVAGKPRRFADDVLRAAFAAIFGPRKKQ